MLTKDESDKLITIARNWQNHHSLNTGNSYLQMVSAIDEMTAKEEPQPSEAGCEMCGDNTKPLHLHSRCHMTAPLMAVIEGDVLTLSCYVPDCKRLVAKMVVSQLI